MDRYFRRQSESSEDSPPPSPCHSSDSSQHAGKFWEAHNLQVVLPNLKLVESDVLQRLPFGGTNLKEPPGSPYTFATPTLSAGQHSARRVLHCSRSYSDVSNWLDQQISMRESARAQPPGAVLDSGGAAAALQNNGSSLTTTVSDDLVYLDLKELQVTPSAGSYCQDVSGMVLQGPIGAPLLVLVACNGDELPPPAFKLLGLL
eukprot:gene4580-4834_t